MNSAVEAVLCHHYNGEHKAEAFMWCLLWIEYSFAFTPSYYVLLGRTPFYGYESLFQSKRMSKVDDFSILTAKLNRNICLRRVVF